MASDYIETNYTQKRIAHRIERIQKKLNNLPDDDSLSEHGYWSKGYYEGILSVLEDMLDETPQSLSDNTNTGGH